MGKRLTGNLAMLLALVILAVPWTLHRATALESAATVLSGAAVGLFGIASSFAAVQYRRDAGRSMHGAPKNRHTGRAARTVGLPMTEGAGEDYLIVVAAAAKEVAYAKEFGTRHPHARSVDRVRRSAGHVRRV